MAKVKITIFKYYESIIECDIKSKTNSKAWMIKFKGLYVK